MNLNLLSYLLFFPTMVGIAVYVAQVCHRNGRLWMMRIFDHEAQFVDAVNKVLLVGCYTLTAGYVAVVLSLWEPITTLPQMLSVLSQRVALILFTLAALHYQNIAVLLLWSRNQASSNHQHRYAMTSKIIVAYAIYLPVVLLLTFYVARTLFANGRVFMLDIFKGKEDIANATNKLFEVGFYLLNMGFALLILKIDQGREESWSIITDATVTRFAHTLDTNQEVVEVLAFKLGGFAIYLGVMLFLNLFLFFRGRRKSRMNGTLPPPVPIPVIATPTR